MKKKRGIFVLLVVALLMAGVAVAYWSSNIRIGSTAHMAGMILVFDNYEPLVCTEFHEVGGVLTPGELCGENVGETTCCYQGVITDPNTENWGYGNIIIAIENAYPGYEVHVTFTVHNIGSIPVDIIEFVVTDPTGALTWDNNKGNLVDNNGKPIINIDFVNLVGEQVNPGDRVRSEFGFLIMHDAQEGYTYSFEIAIVYTQWGQTVTTPDTGNPDGNWQDYREVEISIDHPENYPILVNLPFAADDSIRFLENFNRTKDDIREGDFLSYWMDPDNNYRVWVRRMDNFTSEGSDNAIYCLYGNPLAAPMSSGENTFTYWKDANFTTDWTIVSGTFSESAGILTSTYAGANFIVSTENRATTLMYEGKIRNSGVTGDHANSIILAYADTNNYYKAYLWAGSATNNRSLMKMVGGSSTIIVISNWDRDTAWHTIGTVWENTTRLSLYYDYELLDTSDNGNSAFTEGYFGFRMSYANQQADWFRIRKFVSPEPTTYAGAEQTIQ